MIIILITTIIRITKAFRCSILTVQTSHCRQHCTNLQNCQIVWFCSLSSQSWYCVWLFDLCLIWSWSEFVWSEARQTLVYGEIPHKVNTNWNCLGQVLQGARRTNGMIIAMIIITGTLLWFVWWVERGFPDLLEPPDPFRAWVDSQKELEGGEEGSLVRNNNNNFLVFQFKLYLFCWFGLCPKSESESNMLIVNTWYCISSESTGAARTSNRKQTMTSTSSLTSTPRLPSRLTGRQRSMREDTSITTSTSYLPSNFKGRRMSFRPTFLEDSIACAISSP